MITHITLYAAKDVIVLSERERERNDCVGWINAERRWRLLGGLPLFLVCWR